MRKKTINLFDTYAGPNINDRYMLLHVICASCNRHHVYLVERDRLVIFNQPPKDAVLEGIDPIVQRERGLI